NGKTFNLPSDFEGKLNLVFLAYYRNQQENIDTWLPLARKLKEETPDLMYYEIPTLQNYAQSFRNYIDNGMRRGIPDTRVRAITITLYLNQKSF
ncbi:hypothetical protein ABTO94_20055, partial [Acinetobacter baumannii]